MSKHLNHFQKGQIKALVDEGITVRMISEKTGISKSTVGRVVHKV